MSVKPVFRRKRYIVKKGLQFRYIGVMFALVVLVSIVTGYTVFATGWTLLGERLANVYPQGRLVEVFHETNLALIKNLLFISPLIFALGLLFSHKIAGPVYRIEKTIHEIVRGNLGSRIRLRKGDELRDLADTINTMTENFNSSITLNKENLLKIKKELGEVKKAINTQPYDPQKAAYTMGNLQARIEELNSSLAKWTTTP